MGGGVGADRNSATLPDSFWVMLKARSPSHVNSLDIIGRVGTTVCLNMIEPLVTLTGDQGFVQTKVANPRTSEVQHAGKPQETRILSRNP